jgi:hypothetical protein
LRRATKARAERIELLQARDGFVPTPQESHDCDACFRGVHDPDYTDEGIAVCLCCGQDMTDEGFPRLELT